MARVSGIDLLEAEGVDAESVAARIDERREKLRSEVAPRRGQALEREVRRQRAARGRRGGEDEARARIAPSWGSWGAERRRDPSGPRAARLAARLGADAPPHVPARDAAAALRLDPRSRHQRQDLGGADDGGAARGPRLSRPAPMSRLTSRTGANGSSSAESRSRPRAFEDALERADQAAQAADRAAGEDGPVTQFELLTAAAFVALAAAKVKVGVIEAGLGGRLDATNVIPSLATVLTSVGLDHTEYLGDTIAEIAGEKLAVLHDRSVLVHGELHPDAEVAAERAAAGISRGRVVAGVPPAGDRRRDAALPAAKPRARPRGGAARHGRAALRRRLRGPRLAARSGQGAGAARRARSLSSTPPTTRTARWLWPRPFRA